MLALPESFTRYCSWRKTDRESSFILTRDYGVAGPDEAGRFLFLCASALLMTMLLSNAAVASDGGGSNVIRFDISRQRADQALIEFAEQADVTFIFPAAEARKVMANAVRGEFTSQEAITKLLQGTGLEPGFNASGAWTVKADDNSADKGDAVKQRGLLAGLAAALTGWIAAHANAEQSVGTELAQTTLEEIVVTAQKREQRVLDVPMSMTALTGDALEREGIRTMGDLASVVPDLSMSEYGQNQTPSIRGIGNSNGSSSLVGIYLDEAAVTGGPAFQLDLRVVDLERVEVLRGPQGTLYGEGSTSGTVRFITRDPELTRIGGSTDVALFDTTKGAWSQSFTGVLNLPLVSDVFGIRVSGTYENAGGWIDQPAAGRSDINDNELANVRAKALWRLSDSMTVKGAAIVHRNEGGGYNFVNLPPREDSMFSPRVDSQAETPFSDDYEIYSLTGTYDFERASLLLTSAYTNLDRAYVDATRSYQFLPATSAPIEYLITGTLGFQASSHELRVVSLPGPLNWTVGAFYRDYEESVINRLDFVRGTATGTTQSGVGRTSESWAVFGDVSYDLTDRLEAGVGVRYFEDERTQTNLLTLFTQDDTFDSVSPRVYLSYAISGTANVYANVAKGFRSGGFNTGALGGAPAAPYQPETLWSYELGTKLTLSGGRFSADIALHFSDYKDMQTFGLPTTGSFAGSFTANVGKAEVKGLDAEFSWAPTKALTLAFGGNVLESEVVAVDATATTRQIDPGDTLDLIPEYQYYLSANYSLRWGPAVQGYLRASYNEQGETTATLRNSGLVNPIGKSDTVSFLNLGVGALWNRWTFEVYSQNALDEAGSVTPFEWASIAAQARPTTIGVQVGYDF